MKMSNMIKAFIFVCFVSTKLIAGETYVIRYSPANPVAGQAVTFTLEEGELPCYLESVIPDAANDINNLIEFPAEYTYPTPGTYHVALDVVFDPTQTACQASLRQNSSNKRALITNFTMGPVGGATSPAVMLNGIFCAPLIIGAPAPIPTLSQWMVICLGLLSGIIGTVYFLYNRKENYKSL